MNRLKFMQILIFIIEYFSKDKVDIKYFIT